MILMFYQSLVVKEFPLAWKIQKGSNCLTLPLQKFIFNFERGDPEQLLCAGGQMYAQIPLACMWRSEDTFLELVFPSHLSIYS